MRSFQVSITYKGRQCQCLARVEFNPTRLIEILHGKDPIEHRIGFAERERIMREAEKLNTEEYWTPINYTTDIA